MRFNVKNGVFLLNLFLDQFVDLNESFHLISKVRVLYETLDLLFLFIHMFSNFKSFARNSERERSQHNLSFISVCNVIFDYMLDHRSKILIIKLFHYFDSFKLNSTKVNKLTFMGKSICRVLPSLL